MYVRIYDGVVPARVPWMAPSDPLHRFPRPASQAEHADGVVRVLRTCGGEPTPRCRAGPQDLIPANDPSPGSSCKRHLSHGPLAYTERRSLTIPGRRRPCRPSSRRSDTPIPVAGAPDVRARWRGVVGASDCESRRCHWRVRSRTRPRGDQLHRRRSDAPRPVRHVAAGLGRVQQRSHGCELGESGRNPSAAPRSA